jgi:hypothetical protein
LAKVLQLLLVVLLAAAVLGLVHKQYLQLK